MSKKERILGTCTLIASFLPYLLAAISLQYLPDKVPLIQLLADAPVILVSKYNNLVMGVFSLIPICLVALSRFFKRKMLVDRNFGALLLAALLISLVFLGMMIFSLVKQSEGIDILYRVDIISVVTIVLCLGSAAFGGAMPFFRPNDIFGLRNQYTNRNSAVWKKIHAVGGEAVIVLYLLITLPMPFMPGWANLLLYVLSTVFFYIFIYMFSKRTYNKILADKLNEKESDVIITDI